MIALPHDLLRVDPALARTWDGPAWVCAALERAPWVVVRRAPAAPSIPVGVRGRSRSERFAASLAPAGVRERLAPRALRARIGTSSSARLDAAARRVDAAARASRIGWGPAGAYGFELASGAAVTHAASDLDGIVVPAPRARLAAFAAACAAIARETDVRIDLELQLPAGGVALAEYLDDDERVLAKTASGPALIARTG